MNNILLNSNCLNYIITGVSGFTRTVFTCCFFNVDDESLFKMKVCMCNNNNNIINHIFLDNLGTILHIINI